MTRFLVCDSILKKFLIVASLLVFVWVPTPVLAQHGCHVGGGGHFNGGGRMGVRFADARPVQCAGVTCVVGVRYPFMPLTVFDTKGIPATRRERIEAAVVAGGKHVAAPHEAWIPAIRSVTACAC